MPKCGYRHNHSKKNYLYSYILRRKLLVMSVQVENLEKNMVKLTIEVPAEEVEKALNAAYQKQ